MIRTALHLALTAAGCLSGYRRGWNAGYEAACKDAMALFDARGPSVVAREARARGPLADQARWN